jgi:AcrR family transcriptional regulator
VAVKLFVEHGFHETTTDQIAARVGMSSRSLFRYFATKEDMVVGSLVPFGDRLAELVEERPSTESAWDAVHKALQQYVAEFLETMDGTAMTYGKLVDSTPALRLAMLDITEQWTEKLVPDVSRRLKGPVARRDYRARALVTAALSCLTTAGTEWVRTDGAKPVGQLLDLAITTVRS